MSKTQKNNIAELRNMIIQNYFNLEAKLDKLNETIDELQSELQNREDSEKKGEKVE
ncbi:MAG: hypothetical protein ACFFKA_13115 [Candidatus Thorarchaeota archaeon]